MIVNSDVYWHSLVKKDLLRLFNYHCKNSYKYKCSLLLSSLEKSYGIEKNKGDFVKKYGLILRNRSYKKGFIFSGAQLIDSSIFKLYKKKIFSLNIVWDLLIKQKKISGLVMKSNWLHVSNLKSFKLLKNFKA